MREGCWCENRCKNVTNKGRRRLELGELMNEEDVESDDSGVNENENDDNEEEDLFWEWLE